MAIPQFRGEGVDQGGGSGAFTISFTSFTWAIGDIIEIVMATDGWVPVMTTANGFALAVGSDGNSASVTTNGGTAGTADCGIFVYWKRAVGTTPTSDPPPVFQAPSVSGGTAWCVQPNSFSGARSSGTPYHVITTAIVSTASASVTSVAATSTLANCLFMPRVASANDDQAFNSWTMTGSASPSGTKAPDTGWHQGAGNACAFIGDEGGFATAGGPHTATTTFGAATKQAQVTLVMASLAEVAGITGNQAGTLDSSSAGSSGGVAISGTAAGTLGGSSSSSAGGVAVAGAAAANLGASTAASSGSSVTRTGTEAATLAASIASSSGTVTVGPVGTESATLGASAGSAIGAIALTGTEAAALAGSSAAESGSVSIAGTESAAGSSSTAAATGTVSTPATLTLGKVAIRQKANTTSPNSGTLTTFPVYPAWTGSTVYALANAVRVTNAGNIYELQQDGTSASSGGPSTTGAAITDGSAKWNYLGPGTGAMDTQTSGSFLLATVAWGRDATGGAAPTDNKGNTWTQLQKNFYSGFPSSSQAIYSAGSTPAGGTGHTLSAAFGLGNDGGGDEITAILLEVIGGTHIQDRSYVERASSTGNVVTSASVTTTGPAMLVAFWWLNGTVRPGGTNHVATPGSPFVEVPEGRALMEIGPSGAGEVQVTTHVASVGSAGTYTASITTTLGEGSAVYLVAIQGVVGITGTGSGLSSASIASSSGLVTTPRTGTEAAALASSSGAAAGTISLTGNGSAAGRSSTAAAAGTVAITGTEISTAGGSIASSSGTLIPVVTGTETATLAASIAASFGTVLSGHVGLGAGLLAGSAVAAAGTVLATGTGADVAAASSPSIAGAVAITGATGAESSSSLASSAGTVGLGAGQFRRLVGTLARANQLFATLQLEGVNVLDLTGPILVYQGDTADFLLTVTDDAGGRIDLSSATIELQVKAEVNDPDPPLISKSVGAGWTLLDQTAPLTKGQATCSLTTPETSITAKRYMLDVVVVVAGQRAHVVPPHVFIIGAVVNGP